MCFTLTNDLDYQLFAAFSEFSSVFSACSEVYLTVRHFGEKSHDCKQRTEKAGKKKSR